MSPVPYYDFGGVTLYLGDCREITAWLDADVLVTDPPYGRAWSPAGTKGRPGGRVKKSDYNKPGIANDQDTTARDEALAAWGPRPSVVFGHLLLAPPEDTQQVLIYRKAPGAGGRGGAAGFRRDLEAIYLLGGWPTGMGGISSVIGTAARVQGSPNGLAARYGHSHAKPLDVMETLIRACPPGVIADPFAGGGSTLIAARNEGRHSVGVEISEAYCEVIARRLDQGSLFTGVAE